MLDIKSVLTYIMQGIAKQDPRYIIEGDERIIDSKTGICIHVYANWFKVTHEDRDVATKDDFTIDEQTVIWNIKKLVTDPEVLKQQEVDYKPLQIERRKQLSTLFEKPTPLKDNLPTAETGTATYTG